MKHESVSFWTTKQLAEETNLSEVHIRRLLADGAIHGQKIGRDWIISDEEAKRFITERQSRWSKY